MRAGFLCTSHQASSSSGDEALELTKQAVGFVEQALDISCSSKNLKRYAFITYALVKWPPFRLSLAHRHLYLA